MMYGMLLTDDVFRKKNFLILKNWGVVFGLDLCYYPLLFFVFNHRLKIFGWNVLGEIAATY